MSARDVLTEHGVTRKEGEVLDALGEHLTNAEIATRLYVSERTVESHVSSLLRKLAASNRHELVRVAAAMSDVTPVRPALLPATLELASESGPLVGRDDELDRLEHLWRHVTEGYSLVAVVTGEAGIGKSRLVAEFARSVHGVGGRVLLGACFEDLQLPYQPFVQAIAADLDGLPADERRRRVASDGAALGRLLPELGDGTAPGEMVDAPSERADLMGAVHDYLIRAAQHTPLLLVIEDLHWATATTRDTVRHLARITARAPLLAVVTSRATPPDATDELAELLSDLARAPSAHRIAIDGLDRSGVDHLVAAITQTGGIDADVVYAATRGNPLFVREMVAAGGGPLPLGASVRTLLADRSRRLNDDDNAVLDLAAVVGAEFDADLIAAAGASPLTDVLDALEQAERAGLVNPLPGRSGRFGFVHALFRSTRYDMLPLGRRLGLHQQVARALAPRAADDAVVPELAHHACVAAPLGGASAAVGYVRRAGDLAAASLAFAEAAGHYRDALGITERMQPIDEAVRCDILLQLGQALTWAGDGEARAVLHQATHIARRLGEPGRLAAAAWALRPNGLGLGWAWRPGEQGLLDPLLDALSEAALAAIGPEPTASRARLLMVRGARARLLTILRSDTSAGEPQRAQALLDEALAVARRANDPSALAEVLATYQESSWDPDRLEQRVAISDELQRLGEQLGQPIFRVLAFSAQTVNLLEVGEVDAAWAVADVLESLVNDRQIALGAVRVANCRATKRFMNGDLLGAERAAEAPLPVIADARFDAMAYYVNHLVVIRFNQGRVAELLPLITARTQANPPIIAYNAVRAMALARAGDIPAARQLLRTFIDAPAALPRTLQWYSGMMSLADAADITGDIDAATVLASQLSDYSGRLAHHGSNVTHPVDVALAQLCLVRHHDRHAETFARRVVEASRCANTPIFLARGLVLQAAARSRLGDNDDFIPLVDEALDIAQRTGAGLIEQEVLRYQLK